MSLWTVEAMTKAMGAKPRGPLPPWHRRQKAEGEQQPRDEARAHQIGPLPRVELRDDQIARPLPPDQVEHDEVRCHARGSGTHERDRGLDDTAVGVERSERCQRHRGSRRTSLGRDPIDPQELTAPERGRREERDTGNGPQEPAR